MNCLWGFNIPLLDTNPIIINCTSGWRGGGLPYERDGNVQRRIRIKGDLKETNLGVAYPFLTTTGDHTPTQYNSICYHEPS